MRIVPVERLHRHAELPRNGIQAVARAHRVRQQRPQDQQALAHRQPVRLPQAVVAGDQSRRNAVHPSDRVECIAAFYHMDLQKHHLPTLYAHAALEFPFPCGYTIIK